MTAQRTLAERFAEAPHLFDPDLAGLVRDTADGDAPALAPALEPAGISNPTNRLVPTAFDVDRTRAGGGRVVENHLGLLGPVAALPVQYTHEAIGERKRRSASLADFLEIFAQPLRRMFVDAHRKYRLASLFQLYRSGSGNRIAGAVFALLGFATERQRSALALDPEVPLFYAGYFANQRRNAVSLERMLEDFLGVDVRVIQFQRRRLPVAADEQTRMGTPDGLGRLGGNSELGRNAMAGASFVDRRGAIRIRLGPVDYPRYLSLMPDAGLYGQIVELVRLYVGPATMFDLQIVLRREDVPATKLQTGAPVGRLGWDTWALNGPATRDSEDTVFDPDVVAAG